MRIIYLGNNWLGWKVAEWLSGKKENIVGLVLPAVKHQKYGPEIIAASVLNKSKIFEGSNLERPTVLEKIRELKPDIGISILFNKILKSPFLEILPYGCINLHPSYLPYNRGAYPNVWSIVDGTPAGVTIHYIDQGVDTGGIISQSEIPVEPFDTGDSLYGKLENEALKLFKETWLTIRSGNIKAISQKHDHGTYHVAKDVRRIDEIDLDASYTAKDLINIIRARTYPPYKGAYFMHNGSKIYLRLDLIPDEELSDEEADE